MCGLVGVFGKISTVPLEAIFEDLLIVDAVRGKDSTGVAILQNEKSKPKVIKGAVSPLSIINSKPYERAKEGHHLLMMGHNRAATVGKLSDQNAHPFKAKHITLAHNGTLLPGCKILKDSKFETDSEAICHTIANEGIEKAYPQFDGAVTLTYWDEKEKTFNILSDGKRSIYFAYDDDKEVMFYASEMWMIRIAVERNREKLFKDKDVDVWYPTKHTLFSFKFKKDKVGFETTKLTPFEPVYSYRNYAVMGEYDYGDNYYNQLMHERRRNIIPFTTRREQQDKKLPTIIDNSAEKNFLNYKRDYSHLLAPRLLDEAAFRKHYETCVLCKESVVDAYDTTVIVHDKVAICDDCVFTSYVHDLPLETVYKQ